MSSLLMKCPWNLRTVLCEAIAGFWGSALRPPAVVYTLEGKARYHPIKQLRAIMARLRTGKQGECLGGGCPSSYAVQGRSRRRGGGENRAPLQALSFLFKV